MTGYIQSFLDFVSLHPHLAGLITFLTAAAEAIAIVGSLVPGTTILIGIGALVGYGHLELWPILAWAVAGAVVGDGISYWIGHAYKESIRQRWPFSRRPELIDRGEAFFLRYGGLSVVVGRFVPVMRAIVPVVAGILGMRPLRFYIANIASALLWAPAHILPGVLAGAALGGLGLVSKRLVIVLVGLAVLALLLVWLAKFLVAVSLRYLPRAQSAVARWADAHRGRPAGAIFWLVSADHADFRLLVLLTAVLIGSVVGLSALFEGVVSGGALVRFDHAFSQFVQALRTVWTDAVMVAVTLLGDGSVTASVAVVASAVLLAHRRGRLAAGLLVVVLSSVVFVQGMKWVIDAVRPIDFARGASAFSFPSGHATLAAALYGALGWLFARGLKGIGRKLVLATLAGLIAAIAFSRVYLAAHGPSDVAAGLVFGAGVTAAFALVFRDTGLPSRAVLGLLAACGTAFVLVGAWHVVRNFEAGLAAYARRPPQPVTLTSAWREGGWRDLPSARIDIAGEAEEPFLLQWRGSGASLAAQLEGHGWVQPPPWSLETLNGFVEASTAATALPVVPVFHDGHRPAVTLIRAGQWAGGAGRFVLRAWPQGIREPDGSRSTLLLASIVFEEVQHPWGQLSIPLRSKRAACDGDALLLPLPKAQAVGSARGADAGACGGRTILAQP